MRKRESKLSSAYYDIKGVGSFGGIQALAKKTKGNQKQIKDWLESQDAYTLHKQVRYRFPPRKTIVSGPSQQWQADLIDVSRLSRHNQGNKFLLTCIDVFSKKAWVVPLKNNSGISLVAAFKSIQHPLPKTLQTDKGTEFLNYTFQQWLKDHKVHFFTTENEDIKASIVERFNKTLKTKLWCYFTHHDTLTYTDILESVVDVYNHTPHRRIGMTPNDVTSANKGRVWLQLYADPMPYKEPTLRVGDTVCISKARLAFKKGYLAQWTEEIFIIVKRKSTQPPTFVLADYGGEVLKGTFYPQELQKVNKTDNVYQVEKILKRTKNRVFMKWWAYPDKFNSWVNVKYLVWYFIWLYFWFSLVVSYCLPSWWKSRKPCHLEMIMWLWNIM